MNYILIIDKARIHKAERIVNFIKEHWMVVFTFLLYSPELIRIDNTFRWLKTQISFKNLNSNELKRIIIEKLRVSNKE